MIQWEQWLHSPANDTVQNRLPVLTTLGLLVINRQNISVITRQCIYHGSHHSHGHQAQFTTHTHTSTATSPANKPLISWYEWRNKYTPVLYHEFTDEQTHQHKKSTCRRDNSHTPTIRANFCQFPRRVRQTQANDVIGKRSQAVVSRSDDKCVTWLVGEITSPSAS